MKGFSYYLFPPLLRILGLLFIALAIYAIVFNVDYSLLDEQYVKIVGGLGFAMIGLIFITFRGRFCLNMQKTKVVRKYWVMGMKLKGTVIPIPDDVSYVQIQHTRKKGRGYIRAVHGVTYRVESFDVYFIRDKKVRRIINTDFRTANKVVRFLKQELGFDYHIEIQGDPAK